MGASVPVLDEKRQCFGLRENTAYAMIATSNVALPRGFQPVRDTSLRLLAMLKIIPRRPPGINARDLREKLEKRGYEVSKRTVERDLVRLSGQFPLASEGSRPEYWSWMPGAAEQALPGHDPMSALTWQLVEEYLQPLMPLSVRDELEPQFKAARNFLCESGSQKLRRWKDRVRYLPRAMPLPPPKIDSDVLEAAYTALLEGRQLEVHYRSRGQSKARPLTLNPLALVVRESVYYLIVVIEPFDDTVHTTLHRMSRPRLLDTRVRESKGFDLDDHIRDGRFQYASGRRIRLVARFDAYAAQALIEAPLSENQSTKALDDDRIEVSATVMESSQLMWWLLGFGSNVEVVGPKELRQAVTAEIESLSNRYCVRDHEGEEHGG